MTGSSLYVGLMSGTSLDGVDGILMDLPPAAPPAILTHAHSPFSDQLHQDLLRLNSSSPDEIHLSALAANALARSYAAVVSSLLSQSGLSSQHISAIGCHGQTIRHRPDLGFTLQIGNSALLAELTGISVISDFRARDVAAGGQGAPLVPAFHHALFAVPDRHRVIVNIGGIANLTDLPSSNGKVTGFDCGPGNVFMDAWIRQHQGLPYDADGAWARQGRVIPHLLERCLQHPFMAMPPPKSTGRDTFHMDWLNSLILPDDAPVNVQATLLEFTARGIANAVHTSCSSAHEVYLCGGGARNLALQERLQQLLAPRQVSTTLALGIEVELVEAAAFAWLARQCLLHQSGNLPAVTGAAGPRVLGAIYPA